MIVLTRCYCYLKRSFIVCYVKNVFLGSKLFLFSPNKSFLGRKLSLHKSFLHFSSFSLCRVALDDYCILCNFKFPSTSTLLPLVDQVEIGRQQVLRLWTKFSQEPIVQISVCLSATTVKFLIVAVALIRTKNLIFQYLIPKAPLRLLLEVLYEKFNHHARLSLWTAPKESPNPSRLMVKICPMSQFNAHISFKIISSRSHRRWDGGSYGFYLRFFFASSFAYNFVRK